MRRDVQHRKDGLTPERKHPRGLTPERRYSFENELTFTPKLNINSRKINHNSFLERSKLERKSIEDHDISSTTNFNANRKKYSRIVAKLETKSKNSFQDTPTETTNNNVNIESLCIHESLAETKQFPTNTECSSKFPIKENSSTNENLDKTTSNILDNVSSKITNTIEPEIKTNKDCIMGNKKLTNRIPVNIESTNEIQVNTQLNNNILANTESTNRIPADIELTNKTSNSLKISSPRKNIDLISVSPRKKNKYVSDEDLNERKSKLINRKHERSLTYPLPTKNIEKAEILDENYQKMVKAKKIAGNAIKKKKIFLCNGPYQTIRQALRHRGWIEKNFKADPTVKLKQRRKSNSKGCEITESITSHNKDDVIENESSCEEINNVTQSNFDSKDSRMGNLEKTTNETQVLNNSTNENSEDINEEFSNDDQYGIMSRVVRNSTPTLIWTLKRDDIDFRYLRKDQIVNHYISAWSFTTKAGLCLNLRNVRYFENINSLSFFPRCYRLCCSEERDDFIDDFRLTSVLGLIKILIIRHDEWKNIENEINENLEKDKDIMKGKNLLTECGMDVNENKRKHPKVLSLNVLNLALRVCYTYLDTKENKDIEEGYSEFEHELTDETWKTIVDYYYQIARGVSIISKAYQHVQECREILKKMEFYFPQMNIDGYRNLWILKPGAKSRGRGIEIKNRLDDILNVICDSIYGVENRWVIQKYIEHPYLIYRTKFDIRQWFLVTDWNPLTLWFYKDCYIRFCSQEFTMDKFDAKFHLSNNSVQKHYKNGERSEHLPESNMWSSDTFKKYLFKRGHKTSWDEIIYPGMKKAIILSLQCCQSTTEYRKNSFELYGADFMLTNDFQPWLIEINSSPALGASTPVTEMLCSNVIEDTLKVVLDRRENRHADTGRFELAYKQPFIPTPSYMGCNISIEGYSLRPPPIPNSKLKSKSNERIGCLTETVERKNSHFENTENSESTRAVVVTPEVTSMNPKNNENSQIFDIFKSISINEKVVVDQTYLPEIPIERIKKRHNYLSIMTNESVKKLSHINLKNNEYWSQSENTIQKSKLEMPMNLSTAKCSISNGYFCQNGIRKDFLDENIRLVQSNASRTIKLKLKKPVKEVNRKLRYNRQLNTCSNSKRTGENNDSFSKYETSLTRQLTLRQ